MSPELATAAHNYAEANRVLANVQDSYEHAERKAAEWRDAREAARRDAEAARIQLVNVARGVQS